MAFNLTWTIEYGDITGNTAITSYVIDGMVDAQAEIGSPGRTQCRINLTNLGGQFTPNGTGTYASVNWYSKALFVKATGGGITRTVFAGMITGFDVFNANSKDSYATITATDILSFAGRSTTRSGASYGSGSIAAIIQSLFTNLGTPGYQDFVPVPKMGGTQQPLFTVTPITGSGVFNETQVDAGKLPSGRFGDWLATGILPSGPATCFATTAAVTGTYPVSAEWNWYVYVVDANLNRTPTYAATYTLVDGSTALSSGQIPFTEIHVGYQVDELVNTATIDDNGGLTAATTTDTTSQDSYGVQSYNATQTINQAQTSVTRASQFWANRYGTIRYIPDSITTTYSALKGDAVDDNAAMQKFVDLCSAENALWSQIAITFKTVGMSTSQTSQVIPTRRRVMFSPSDTRISLDLKSGIDNQSFQLDSSTYGILDTNRLG